VTGVQTCALPISFGAAFTPPAGGVVHAAATIATNAHRHSTDRVTRSIGVPFQYLISREATGGQ
jgi:hypothetical protein